MTARVMLTEEDFATLIKGGVVQTQTSQNKLIEIALSDIGYLTMFRIIAAQIESREKNARHNSPHSEPC